eukprot:CAMPEP_0118638894 /NCGR_PEP_ID=MMETSP0785-20121206/3939_1 /TAXON_ID=91992 /ORGANISM="Bolidomonas pacifica, Strain CCMP 1866" /LENGTH=60 /DNA_ID=CAMNT_0006530197 /DNA_START=566 /DNA_END=748 /DNA_ORIENTATION=-
MPGFLVASFTALAAAETIDLPGPALLALVASASVSKARAKRKRESSGAPGATALSESTCA